MSTSSGNAMILVAMIVISPMLPRVMETLGITPFKAGLALSIMWAAAGVFQFPGGQASDQLSRKTVLVSSLAILVAATLLLTRSKSYFTFVVAVTAIGVSAGLYWPTMFALGADHFEEHRGGAFGIIAGSGDLGGLLATVLATIVLATVAWQLAFLPIAIIGGVILLSVHVWHAEPYVVTSIDLRAQETLRNLLSTTRLQMTVVAFGLFMFVYQGTTSFLPTLLQEDMAFGEGLANSALAVLFVIGIVVKPFAGRVGDRIGYAVATGVAMTIALGGLVLLLIGTGRLLVFLGLVGFAIGVAATWPTIITYVTAHVPHGSIGGDLGAFRTMGFVFGSLGSSYVGFVAERASFTLAFVGFSACLAMVVIVVLGLIYRY